MRKKKSLLVFVLLLAIIASFNLVKAAEIVPDDGAIITSSQIIQMKTGTGPWDENNEPGNDTSEDNNVVRSFDQVTWTIENTMAINGTGAEGYTGGTIYFEAKLPDVLKNKMGVWDTSSMQWIKNPKVSTDGTTLTGTYDLNTTSNTIPGKQTLVFVAKINGVLNGTEIEPTFKIWLNGNTENEKVTVKSEKITISAAANYNLVLLRNTHWAGARATLDFDGTSKTGRVYGYFAGLQLYNENVSKGLKGIEYPQGNISFDIDLAMEKSDLGSSELEDISDDMDLLLWNYKVCSGSFTDGVIPNRTFVGESSPAAGSGVYSLPNGKGGGTQAVFDSGKVSMTQEGNVIHVNVSDYKFNGTFPIYAASKTPDSKIVFTDNIGCFGSYYFQIMVPDNDATNEENKNYYLKISDSNFKATSLSNDTITEQAKKDDDDTSVNYVRYAPGTYDQDMWACEKDSLTKLSTHYNISDGTVTRGQIFRIMVGSRPNIDNEAALGTVDKFFKFDGSAFEPVLYKDKYFTVSSYFVPLTFKMWFVTKPDGTNWSSASEMNKALIENMNRYENIEDIPEGYTIVGEFFESYNGPAGTIPRKYELLYIMANLQVKDEAVIGQTYGFTQASRYWLDVLDRTQYSQSVLDGFKAYPKPVWNTLQRNYIKVEYDELGNQVSGTHSGGYQYGTSLLIVGATQGVTIQSLGTNNATKTNFDIGKNENIVKYKVTPALSIPKTAANATPITGVTLKSTVTLPQGLTYVAGSANYGEPDLTNNDDGTTTLVWYSDNCTAGVAITPILFETAINEETSNGVQYDTTVVVSADNSIVGNTIITKRTATNSIQVTNLASHRLYKTITTPVIELNGDIHFALSYKNNTDDVISDFQMLDILPFNGDTRGTSYNGTYKVDRIVVTSEKDSEVEVFYTTNENARNANSKDENLVDGWTKATSENINSALTAFALVGPVKGQDTVTVDIYISTKDNKGLDKYVNNGSAQVYAATDEMITSNVTSQVIHRMLEGKVWYDLNANGTIDSNEPLAEDILVTLTDETRQQVKDINGNVIPGVKTDANGYYKFDDLPKGKYLVNVTIGDETYILTQKEVGTISSVNSKFNEETGETDEINKLDTVDLPELTVSNVNAGLVKKPTQVIVNYKEVGTEAILNPQITIDGRIDDEYTTVDKLTDINKANGNKYEFVETTGAQTSGTMVEDTLEVTYWYQKKMAEVEVNYLEVGTNKVLSTKVATQDRVDADYTTANKLDEINTANGNKYEFVETTGAAVNGKYTVDKQVINYWYQKKMAEIEVNYLEKGTNAVLANQETASDRIDATYTTVNKLTEINAANANKYEFVEITGAAANGTYAVDKQVINYWYQKKATNVIVKYVDVNSNEEIYDQATIAGKIDDDYETVNELDNINKKYNNAYEFVRDTQNTSGTMTEDTIEVIYYYQKKATNVIVKYVDADTNEEIYDQAEITGRIDDDYETVNELDNINKNFDNKYAFVRVTDNAEGKMTADTIEVTYYYQKKEATIEVNYLEKGTETVLLDKVTKGGKVDADYTTENKLTEINSANGNKYEFVETTGAATEGKYTVDKQVINYYYQKKPANVIVRYKEVGTEATLSPEVEKTGRVDDAYTTENKLTDINAANNGKYEYVKVDGNANGNMAVDTTYVTYWYQKKATNVIVKYVDVDTQEEIYTKATITGRIDDDYTTVNELDNINAKFDGIYAFTESTNNTAGKMTEGTIEVIYYYQKQLGDIEVNYVELDTNKVLAEKVDKTGKIDSNYTTENKLAEINAANNNSYEYVKVTGTPEGTYKKEKQVITYYYTKKGTKVIVDYVDADTNESIYDTATINGKVDDPYTTVNELDNINEKHNNKYEFVSVTNNKDGNMTLDTIHVIYTYSKKIAEVEVLYKEVGSEIELADKVTMSGKVDSKYETTNKLDEINETYDNIYEFIEVKGKEVGTYTLDKQTITYYYDRKPTNVIVNYVDIETEEKLVEESEITGKVKDNYVTGDMIDIINKEQAPHVYKLVEISGEPNGQMSLDTTYVTYYYKKLRAPVIVKHVDEYGNVLGEEEQEVLIGEEVESKPSTFDGYYCEEEKRIDEVTGELIITYHYKKIEEPEQVETSDMSFALILVVAICSFYGIKKVKFSKNK